MFLQDDIYYNNDDNLAITIARLLLWNRQAKNEVRALWNAVRIKLKELWFASQ